MSRISPSGRVYGWRKDNPDFRDHQFAAAPPASLPATVDISHIAPPVYDQLQLGDCVGNGMAEIIYADQKIEKVATPMLASRLMLYYNARVMENDVSTDAGCAIRDAMISLNKQGVCSESRWPYNIAKFTNKPSAEDYTLALQHTSIAYKSITGLAQMKSCLASGYPFIFGVQVFESFESDEVSRTGIIPLPSANEQNLGGHCLTAWGYSDATQTFKILNHWGTSWGQKGWCTMPYSYLTNSGLSSDFWQLSTIKVPGK